MRLLSPHSRCLIICPDSDFYIRLRWIIVWAQPSLSTGCSQCLEQMKLSELELSVSAELDLAPYEGEQICLCKSQFEHWDIASAFSATCLYSHFYNPSRLIITKILCHCFATVHSLTNLKMQMNAKSQLNLKRLLLPLSPLLPFFLLCWEKKDTADIKCWWWKSIFQIWGNFKLGPSARDSDITRVAWLICDLRRKSLDSILPLSLQREMNVAAFSSFPISYSNGLSVRGRHSERTGVSAWAQTHLLVLPWSSGPGLGLCDCAESAGGFSPL